MDFGFRVPTQDPVTTPNDLVAVAQRGEALGFGIISASDHIVIPRLIESRYPYSESGAFAGGTSGECLEQLTVLAFLAGQTSAIRLLTSVMVLPHRSPVLAAKMLASIDVLSKGRLIVGCGVGWMREEFEAIGAPPYDRRGAVSNEYLRVFKELWASDAPAFEGRYARFSGIQFQPKPVQNPHPPIWIGGESPAALRRAGQLGDGWYPTGDNPSFPLGTREQLADAIAQVRRYGEEVGRDPAEIDFAYNVGWYNDRQAEILPDGSRRVFTGSPEQVAEDIRTFSQINVRHLVFNFQGRTVEEVQNRTVEELLDRMGRFATLVRPLAEL